MKNYNQFLNEVKTQKMTSLIQPTDQQVEDAEKFLEEGKDPNWDYKFGYFYIDVSGKYSVYYTLWKDSPLKTNFITNLSTDFQTAIEKAKKATGRIPVIIDKTGTKAGLFQAAKAEIVTFGKYRGKTLGDIFVEDPKYIIYLFKNYDGKSPERWERIKYYADLYYETITKNNLEKSKSQFVGNIKDRITFEAKVYDAKGPTPNDFGGKPSYPCKLIDEQGNKYQTYNIGGIVQNDDEIKVTGTVTKHNEYLGIKFTTINRCKILWNRREDLLKYNI